MNFEIAIAVVPARTKCFFAVAEDDLSLLRATAVLAFLMPTRLTSRTSQAFKTDHGFTTLSRTLAASKR
jgi:hypothetical protein